MAMVAIAASFVVQWEISDDVEEGMGGRGDIHRDIPINVRASDLARLYWRHETRSSRALARCRGHFEHLDEFLERDKWHRDVQGVSGMSTSLELVPESPSLITCAFRAPAPLDDAGQLANPKCLLGTPHSSAFVDIDGDCLAGESS